MRSEREGTVGYTSRAPRVSRQKKYPEPILLLSGLLSGLPTEPGASRRPKSLLVGSVETENRVAMDMEETDPITSTFTVCVCTR